MSSEELPAVFRLPASKASQKQSQFRFTIPGEKKERHFPKFQYLKPAIALKIEGMPATEALLLLIDNYQPDLVDKLEGLDQMEALINAWQEASDITPGESQPS